MHPGHGSPSRRARPAPGRARFALIRALILAVVVALAVSSPASAHTDIEYTAPADQEQVAEPVTEITVAFSDPVTLVGAGFEVFTPQEEVVQPNVFTEDNMVFLLQLDAPLVGGEAGVRYEVTAADGHLLDGGFRFTVPAAVPATVLPATAPATEPATETSPPTPAAGSTAVPAADSTAPAVIAPAPTATPTPSLDAATADTAVAPADDDGDDDDGGGTSTGLIGGVLAALALGVVAFVVLRSRAARAT